MFRHTCWGKIEGIIFIQGRNFTQFCWSNCLYEDGMKLYIWQLVCHLGNYVVQKCKKISADTNFRESTIPFITQPRWYHCFKKVLLFIELLPLSLSGRGKLSEASEASAKSGEAAPNNALSPSWSPSENRNLLSSPLRKSNPCIRDAK